MKSNLLETLKEQFHAMVVVNLSDYVEEHSSYAFSGLTLIMPIVLGQFIKKASTTEGLQDLMNIVEDSNLPYDLNTRLYDIINSKEELEINIKKGEQLVSKIYGPEIDKLVKLISEVTGIRESSAKVFFNLVTPVLVILIKRRNASMGWGMSGLAGWLMNQASHVENELPPGIAEQAELDDLGDFLGSKYKNNRPVNILRMLIPWVLGLIALLAALYYLRGCSKQDVKLSSVEVQNQRDAEVQTGQIDSTIQNYII